MTDPLDTEIRRVMGTLSERAPMPPSLAEIARRVPRGSRAGFRRGVALVVAAAAVCAVVVGLARLDRGGDSARLVTAGPPATASGPDVRLETLVASYVPTGFLLADDTTEPTSEPVAGSASASTSAVRRTQRYSDSTSGSAPATAAIYVTVTLTPDVVQTPAGVTGLVQNGAPIAVNGRPGAIGVQAGGTSGGVEVRWLVSPHVIVAIYSRGGVDVAELRRMADGIQLAP